MAGLPSNDQPGIGQALERLVEYVLSHGVNAYCKCLQHGYENSLPITEPSWAVSRACVPRWSSRAINEAWRVAGM